jgi:eukaryotic-like serine/threonine-protein kinase
MSEDDPEIPPGEPRAQRMQSWGRRPAVASQDAGRVIAGKYRLVEVLGEGGMGRVWLARNLALDIDVAIKLLHLERSNDRGEVRLLQEARVAAQLQHPSIVRIFDFGHTDGGAPFIVMEVLDGELLSDVLVRKGRLSALNAVATLLPVIDAVAVAHAKEVVHRDLKPENVLLVTDAKGSIIPKVLDFGIAKLKAEQQAGKRRTRTRALVGTPQYMSPEQCSWTDTIDSRSDVWALAVMLYELCSGSLPFNGSNAHSILLAIGSEQPKPLPELAAGDDELWRIVERGLEKDRDLRWANAREFGLALADWASRSGLETDIAGNSIEIQWFSGGQRRPLSVAPPGPRTATERPDGAARPRRDTDSQAHSMESSERETPVRSKRPLAMAVVGALLLIAAALALGRPQIGGRSPLAWARARIYPSTGQSSASKEPASPEPTNQAVIAKPSRAPVVASDAPSATAIASVAAPTETSPPARPIAIPERQPKAVPANKGALPRHRTEW